MLPPKVDATLTVAHAKAIEQHRNAHHKVAQDHRLAQERCEALEEECKALREADRRRETALQDALKLLSMATRGKTQRVQEQQPYVLQLAENAQKDEERRQRIAACSGKPGVQDALFGC